MAASKLTVRLLGQTEAVPTIVFSIAACAAVGAGAMCTVLPGQWVMPRSAGVWGLLGAAGGLACVVQLLATMALKLSRATPVVLVSYISREHPGQPGQPGGPWGAGKLAGWDAWAGWQVMQQRAKSLALVLCGCAQRSAWR